MLTIRIQDEDKAILESLVERQAAELAHHGVEVSAASVIRSLLRKAADEAGIRSHKAKVK